MSLLKYERNRIKIAVLEREKHLFSFNVLHAYSIFLSYFVSLTCIQHYNTGLKSFLQLPSAKIS